MFIGRPRPGSLPESAATPESVYRSRRRFLHRLGLGLAGISSGSALVRASTAAGTPFSRYSPELAGAGLTPTPFELISSYNNFYEFGTDKESPRRLANRGWKTRPWTVAIGGLVARPLTLDVDDLIARCGGLEQRVYRFRCVEAWSMVVPWDGFPFAAVFNLVEPKAEARYVQFTTFLDPANAPGQRSRSFPWPYVEGLTIDEARHPLTLLAAGIYGKPLPHQNGAPLRLVVPWKYGFKSSKSVVRIDFTDTQPRNTWQILQPREYGFFANVNPEVDHPRWSQATERVLGASAFARRQPTLLFNGYAAEVAGLYAGLDLRRHY
jgi:sulfoxide reductase catalytic subunit YedY